MNARQASRSGGGGRGAVKTTEPAPWQGGSAAEGGEPITVVTVGGGSDVPRRTELGRDSVLLVMSDLATIVAGVVVAAVLTRAFAEDDYGRWSVVLALFTTAFLLVDLGVPTLLGRSVGRAPGEARRWLRRSGLMQLSSAALVGPLVIMLGLLRWSDGSAEWRWAIAVLGLATAAQVLSHSHRHLLRAFGEARLEAISRLLDRSLVAIGVSAVALAGGGTVVAFALASALGPLAATGWLVVHGVRAARARDARSTEQGSSGDVQVPPSSTLLRRGLPFMLIMGLGPLLANLDKFLLDEFVGLAAVGVYNVAWVVHRAGLAAPLALRQVLLPWLGEVQGVPAARVRGRVQQALDMALWAVPAGIIVGASVAVLAIPIVFPSEFSGATAVFLVLLGAWSLTLLASPFLSVLQASRSGWIAAVPVAAALVANLGLGLLLIPRFSIMGAAWSTVGAQLILLVVALRLARADLDGLVPGEWRMRLIGAAAVATSGWAAWLRSEATPLAWLLAPGLLIMLVAAIAGWRPRPPLGHWRASSGNDEAA